MQLDFFFLIISALKRENLEDEFHLVSFIVSGGFLFTFFFYPLLINNFTSCMNTNLFTQPTSLNCGLLWHIFCLQLVVSRLCCDSLDIYPSTCCVAKEMPQNHFKLTWGTFHIFRYALSWRLLLYNLIWRLLNLGHWAFKKDFSSAWIAWHCTIMWKSLDQLTKIGQLHEEHRSLHLL